MKLLAIDGNSIINRAFYGIRPLTTKNGEFTNGIYGFLNILFKLLDELNPDGVAVAFDLPAPTFRHEKYPDYKGNRKGMPDELAPQVPLLKELINLMGYKTLECEGYEADDILGALAKKCRESGNECVIATGDRDTFQLIDDTVTVRYSFTKMGRPEVTLYDRDKIREEYALTPAQLVDVKALMGDSSDNIPGVAGIGKIGALKLIQEFGSLDKLYENLDSPKIKPAIRQKLIEGREQAYLSRELGKIECCAPVAFPENFYQKAAVDPKKLKAFLARLEFFKAISKLGLDAVEVDGQEPGDIDESSMKYLPLEDTKELVNALKSAPFADITFQFESERIVKTAFIYNRTITLLNNPDPSVLKEIVETEEIKKRTVDFKSLYEKLKVFQIEPKSVIFDLSLSAYLINPSAPSYDTGRLAAEYAVTVPGIEGLTEPDDFVLESAAVSKLCDKLSGLIDEYGMRDLLFHVEIPLAKVLTDMEEEGFLIDPEGLTNFGKSMEGRIRQIQEEIYKLAGEEFNINSPKQLAVILFEKLQLPSGKKTKSGYSTNVEVLEGLKGYHEIIDLLLEYRMLTKLKSTYVEGLLKAMSGDGRIHSKFNQTETRTGRISSSEPNLQNIPVRSETGKELRRFFKAAEGKVLIDADYSQIELRVLAHIANDRTMIEAFNEDQDIHTITASEVFNVPPMLVNGLLRSRAKAVNFGIVYGIGAFSLSKDIGVTRKEAQQYINNYLKTYAGVAGYMEETIKKAKENGFVTTMFNRRRFLPELSASNANIRGFGERVARNMPIQGASADIIKIAMINVYNRLKSEKLETKLIMQVHDELILEAPANEAKRAKIILKEEMEKAADLKVKLIVDVHEGKTWFDAKG